MKNKRSNKFSFLLLLNILVILSVSTMDKEFTPIKKWNHELFLKISKNSSLKPYLIKEDTEYRKTALMYCLENLNNKYSLDTIKQTIQKSDREATDFYGRTPFFYLLNNNDKLDEYISCPYHINDIILLFLRANLPQNIINNTKLSALRHGNVDDTTIKLLLQLGINIKEARQKTGESYKNALNNNHDLLSAIEEYEKIMIEGTSPEEWINKNKDAYYLDSIFYRAIAHNHRKSIVYFGNINKKFSPEKALIFSLRYNRTDAVPYIIKSLTSSLAVLREKIKPKKITVPEMNTTFFSYFTNLFYTKTNTGKSRMNEDLLIKAYKQAQEQGMTQIVLTLNSFMDKAYIVKLLERKLKLKDTIRFILEFLYAQQDLDILIKNVKH